MEEVRTKEKNQERERIVKILRSFPLSADFAFNEGWWEVGYKALDEVADYLEVEDRDNALKKKLSLSHLNK